ncbi:hypothetical protein BCIN_02g00150 [Botrytis cinerea B05.10]|uniref:Phospholipase/carboxylesterase/thioesterase domain-containing protein n=3 Tax=Botryotinia fuckeliana TaxID=40559 RepID=A0A384J863_BOTFB|nr:hypothetical protein BCIN_02g00150 [Botrytis cinerea B05.10]ATZ46622.1 hypothetical protein BCIN_02g00150 [Botrytis cinerea B05.10]
MKIRVKMTTPRLPTVDDLPKNLLCDILPSRDGKNTNILILLHGLGDTKNGFTQLAKNLSLPQTASLIPQAPTPIPALITGSDLPSFHWARDLEFDSTTGSLDLDADITPSITLLTSMIEMLMKTCNYPPRNIFMFGFGQGGMLALSTLAQTTSSLLRDLELGGAISIGGRLPASFSPPSNADPSQKDNKGRVRTPILIAGGNRKSEITRTALEKVKSTFAEVEYVKWEREGDGMMRGREEVLPLMRFWGRRLKMGVPEGMTEV